ncbi:MAG: 5-formyltetrahydrofolate cyclo-ligase [Alphaproteobacteria bacterium]|nr:5-formyltetrahydrofolate cyclo-ligase [Alphaproteobacteria bacterium]
MTDDLSLSLQDRKRALRAEARHERSLHQDDMDDDARMLAEVFLRHIELPAGAVVASYSPVRDELDPEVLNDELRERGHIIALPVIIGKKKPLIFRVYNEGDRLLANPLGIFEPASAARGIEPDVLFVPLLAFDAQRNRLGYGGGYYDRTIKRLRVNKPVMTVGIAGSYQQVERIPVGPNDVPLDRIVTETGVI